MTIYLLATGLKNEIQNLVSLKNIPAQAHAPRPLYRQQPQYRNLPIKHSIIFVVLTMIASFVICLVIFSLTLFQAVDALSFLAIGDWGGNEYFFWGELCV